MPKVTTKTKFYQLSKLRIKQRKVARELFFQAMIDVKDRSPTKTIIDGRSFRGASVPRFEVRADSEIEITWGCKTAYAFVMHSGTCFIHRCTFSVFKEGEEKQRLTFESFESNKCNVEMSMGNLEELHDECQSITFFRDLIVKNPPCKNTIEARANKYSLR